MTVPDTARAATAVPAPRPSPELARRRTRPPSEYWDVSEARWVAARVAVAGPVSSAGRAAG